MTKWAFAMLPLLVAAMPVKAQNSGQAQIMDATVYFYSDSSELNPSAKALLDALLARASRRTGGEIFLEGHTDTAGSAADNLLLSAQMANAVAAYFVEKGMSQDHIKLAAFGESSLARKTADEVSEPLNRRVVVTITFAQ